MVNQLTDDRTSKFKEALVSSIRIEMNPNEAKSQDMINEVDVDDNKTIYFLEGTQENLLSFYKDQNDEEVDEMICKVDVDGDGHINYEEFIKVMMTNSLS
ncbi:hypothetical protein AAG906_031197 [Vitis piasezkii]